MGVRVCVYAFLHDDCNQNWLAMHPTKSNLFPCSSSIENHVKSAQSGNQWVFHFQAENKTKTTNAVQMNDESGENFPVTPSTHKSHIAHNASKLKSN